MNRLDLDSKMCIECAPRGTRLQRNRLTTEGEICRRPSTEELSVTAGYACNPLLGPDSLGVTTVTGVTALSYNPMRCFSPVPLGTHPSV